MKVAASDAGTGPVDPPPDYAWMVAHARPRAEKRISMVCRSRSMPFYLPLRERTHTYGQRRRIFSSPLFPGYVFCCGSVQDRIWLRQNQHVANLLEVADQQALLTQLRQVELALAGGHIIEVLPYLEAGKRVRVIAGPLKGLEGVVVRGKGTSRIVLNVDMIQQAIVTEIDGDSLAPA